jgi:hypothetical protein
MIRLLFVSTAILVAASSSAQAAGAAANDLGPLLSNQIVRCWNPPAEASIHIKVRFTLAQDGHVVGKPTVTGFNDAAAAAARQAVISCQPYKMPPERFSDWQHAVVTLSAGP